MPSFSALTQVEAFVVACALKAAAILVFAALSARLLRSASAAARHAVWIAGVVGVLALPVAAAALPALRAPGAIAAVRSTLERAGGTIQAFAIAELGGSATHGRGPASRAAATHRRDLASASLSADDILHGVTLDGDGSAVRQMVLLMGLAVWALGVLALVLRLAVGIGRTRRLAERARPITSPALIALARSLAVAQGVRRRVKLLESNAAGMPATMGIRRPAILLPEGAGRWPAERLRAVLAHELAHVARRDCFTHLLAQIACAVYWFNPLVWVAARRMCLERERACDDRTLAAGAAPDRYATLLLETARGARTIGASPVGALAMARPSELETRLLAILDPALRRAPLTHRLRFGLGACAAAAMLPVAALRLDAGVGCQASSVGCVADNVTSDPAGAAEEQVARAANEREATRAIGIESTGVEPTGIESTDIEPTGVEPSSDAPAGIPSQQRLTAVPGHQTAASAEPDTRADSVAHPRSERVPISGAVHRVLTEGVVPAGRDSAIARKLVALLARESRGEHDLVRERAAWALVQMRDGHLVEPLLDALRDADWRVRAYAAWTFGVAPDRRATPALVEALGHPVWRLRAMAAFALRESADPAARPVMIAALGDDAWQVRVGAVGYLHALGDTASLDRLRAARSDRHVAVRLAADEAVAALTPAAH